jgi:non-specific serine/threonine protein kinase
MVTGLVLISENRLDDAIEPAKALLTDAGADAMCRSWALIQIGIIAFLRGDWDECARTSQQGIDNCRADGESWTQVIHLHLLAAATWQAGDAQAAASLLLDALRIDRRLDDLWHRAWTIEALGWVTVDLGQLERAAQLLGIAARCWDHSGANLTAPWEGLREAAMAELRRRLGEARMVREMEAGRRLDQARGLSFVLDDIKPAEAVTIVGPKVSPRELEVAALVAQGCTNRDIAERLCLSPRTVETHVQHLMDKLGVGSRAEIAAWNAREIIAETLA